MQLSIENLKIELQNRATMLPMLVINWNQIILQKRRKSAAQMKLLFLTGEGFQQKQAVVGVVMILGTAT